VVVGYDARHRSLDFAEATAGICAAAGVRAHVLPRPLPTPVLAFAVRHLGAAAGVMVTASHNPPQDNGYKVYDATGRQIVAPVDATIAAGIAATARACDVPVARPDDPDIVRLGDDVVAAYVAGAAQAGVLAEAREVTVAYTPMHGVGADTLHRVFAAAGFAPVVDVAEQVVPDPDFPTVTFPNPEEPGALDLGLATAARAGADVLIANDPDADRLGAAVPTGAGWRVLRGDEIGAIIADHLLRHGAIGTDGVLVTTVVSSSLLSKMADAAGRRFVETLTGFKWIGRAADDVDGGRLAFGYEEALGFCVGDLVQDKDGISAAAVFAEVVATQKAHGRSVLDVLDDLAVTHGVHLTGQWSARVAGSDGMARLREAMARLRAAPPATLAGSAVTEVVDLAAGDPGRKLPPSDVLVLRLGADRIVVRPSGTEPKLKCYVEVVEPVLGELGEARQKAAARLDALTAAIAAATGLGRGEPQAVRAP
jgi:phosphomannomutase